MMSISDRDVELELLEEEALAKQNGDMPSGSYTWSCTRCGEIHEEETYIRGRAYRVRGICPDIPLDEQFPGSTSEPPPKSTRFATVTEWAERRPLRDPLIDGILGHGTLDVLGGHPKTAKSFESLAWSLCVQTGTAWHGRAVRQGQVFYILAESDAHFPTRVRAWMACNAFNEDTGLLVSVRPLALMNTSETEQLIREDLIPGRASLVVVDTLSRTIGLSGGNENSSQDLAQLTANCELIQRRTGATVLLVHHFGKDGMLRGSTVLLAALDSLLIMTSTGKRAGSKGFKLEAGPSRNGPGFEPIHLTLRTIELDDGKTSCVLVPGEAPATTEEAGPSLSKSAEALLKLIAGRAAGFRWGEWQEASGLAESTFKSAFFQLRNAEMVDKAEGRWIATEKGKQWVEGRE